MNPLKIIQFRDAHVETSLMYLNVYGLRYQIYGSLYLCYLTVNRKTYFPYLDVKVGFILHKVGYHIPLS